MFHPHAATVPSLHKARLWNAPVATATTVLPASTPLVSTAVGAERLVTSLLPNWPLKPFPQATGRVARTRV